MRNMGIDIADVEGDAALFLCELAAGAALSLLELVIAATGQPPVYVDQPQDARYVRGAIRLRHGISDRRAAQKIGHELMHVHYDRVGYCADDLEDRCDLGGAAICMPRDEVRAAIRDVSHSYTQLAEHFGVTQSTAILRVGEVTGRPVILFRPAGPIVRGDSFNWPTSLPTIVRAMGERRRDFHMARITDEPDRVAFMASREAWATMGA